MAPGERKEAKAAGVPPLSERQAMVLRAVVAAYVAEAAPAGSRLVSHLLPVALSSASIRSTMGELMELGLLEQPHASSGRIPSDHGLALFVERLVEPRDPAPYQERSLERALDDAEFDGAVYRVSALLSEHTRLLGFVVPPKLDALVLQHVSLVRISSDRVLAVLVSGSGQTHRRIVRDESGATQPELERMAALLNRWTVGRTLPEVRRSLEAELERLRSQAGDLMWRAVRLGLCALEPESGPSDLPSGSDLVIATRLALLDQPEFSDPRRVRSVFEAIETREVLVDLLNRIVSSRGVAVALGEPLESRGLQDCALVAAPVGGGERSAGAIGVIGPTRMDYGHVMGWVGLCSRLLGKRLDGVHPKNEVSVLAAGEGSRASTRQRDEL